MMTHATITQLRNPLLDGMARGFEEQLGQPATVNLPFEDHFGMLVEREIAWRDSRRLQRLLKAARMKTAGACLEDLDTRAARGLDRRLIASLATGQWIREAINLLITGANSVGKTWITCALGNAACR